MLSHNMILQIKYKYKIKKLDKFNLKFQLVLQDKLLLKLCFKFHFFKKIEY